jgi:type IV pilus assembly protein PilW
MNRSPNPPRLARGMTLVELMVGLAIGMALSVAALKVFGDASASAKNIQRATIQIENARYAAELLREDLELAGYYGEIVTQGASYSAPDPCETAPSAFAASPLALPAPIRGLPAVEAVACLNNRRSGTDALVTRRLDTQTVDAASVGVGQVGHHLQVSFCDADPAAARLVLANTSASFTLRNRACTAANRVRLYMPRIYFVASCNRCGTGGDNSPTLKRLDLVGSVWRETALVEGIETLRIEYGFDTDNDGSADVYRTTLGAAGAESRWENVMTLKLHFIIRSPETVLGEKLATAQSFDLGGAGVVEAARDGYVRRAVSSTVRLVNPSAARETQ